MATGATNPNRPDKIAEKVVALLLAQASGMDPIDPSIPEKTEKGKQNNFAGDVANEFIKKLTAILAPAAIVASIIGSETGGVKLFMSSMKVLGNVLGATFAPFLMMGAAAVISLADMISDWLMPNLEDWYTFLLTKGFEIFQTLEDIIVAAANGAADAINMMVEAVTWLVNKIMEWKGQFDQAKAGTQLAGNALFNGANNLTGGMLGNALGMSSAVVSGASGQVEDTVDKAKQGTKLLGGGGAKKLWDALGLKVDENGRPIIGSEGKGFTGRMKDNMSLVLREFRQQNMPQANRMGIAEAAKQAQMNALNMSPFEAKNLQLLEKVAASMEKAVAKLPGPPTTE